MGNQIKLFGLILALAICQFSAYSQTEVTVGAGTSACTGVDCVPTEGDYDYGWCANLLTQSEIGQYGVIDRIWIYVDNSPSSYTMTTQKIYMVETTDNVFADASKPDPASMTEVYSASATFNGAGWHLFTLSSSFTYDNDNLLIYFENRDGSYNLSGDPEFRYTSTSSNYRCKYDNQDGSFPTGSGAQTYNRPNFKLSMTSTDATSELDEPATQVSASTISSLVDTDGEAVEVFKFELIDNGSGDATSTDIGMVTIKPGSSNTADWTDHIQGAKLYDENASAFATLTSVSITDTQIEINMDGSDCEEADGTTGEYTMYIYLNTSNLSDGAILDFRIDADDHDFAKSGNSSTLVASVNSGTDIEGNNHTVGVVATKLGFNSAKPPGFTAPSTNFNCTVEAQDANGNIDTGYSTGTVTIAKASGSGNLTSATGLATQSLASGKFDWTDCQLDTEDTYTITATHSGALTTATSSNVRCIDGTVVQVGATGYDATTIETAYGTNIPGTITGKYIIEIMDNYDPTSESYPITMAAKTGHSSSNTIEIVPASDCTAKTITSTSTTTIDITGADYVTIDGRAGGSGATPILTIQNTSTDDDDNAVTFSGGSTYNTLKYLNLKAQCDDRSSSDGGIVFFSSGTNTNNTISNSVLRESGANLPTFGVLSYAATNTSNTVTACEIVNYAESGVEMTYGSTWTITDNHFYQTSNFTGITDVMTPIYIDDGNGYTITGNYFGGQATSCGGSPYSISTSSRVYGIYIAGSDAGTATVVSNNTFANMSITTTTTSGTAFLPFIFQGSGDFTVGSSGAGNTIGATSGTGSITLTHNGSGTQIFTGFLFEPTGTINAQYNTIGAITVADGSNTAGSMEIFLVEHNDGALTFSNNTIGNTTANNLVFSEQTEVRGFSKVETSGSLTFSDNTFQNFDCNGTTYDVTGFYQYVAGCGPVSITNNTFKSFDCASDAEVIGIYFYASSVASSSTMYNLTGNTVQDFTTTSSNNSAELRGILYYENDGSGDANFNISSNTIKNFTYAGTRDDDSDEAIYGIYAYQGYNGSSESTLNSNYVTNLTATAVSANEIDVEGIYTRVNTSEVINVKKNKVTDLATNSTGASNDLTGIWVYDGQAEIDNNVILLDNNDGGGTTNIYGIYASTDDATSVYHNTIRVYGTASGAFESAAIYFGYTLTATIKNNVFENIRSGGSEEHIAFHLNSNTGITNNYNYLEATTAVGEISTTNSTALADWQTATSEAANSTSGSVDVTAPTGAVTNHANVADAGADLFTGSEVTTDYDGNARDVAPWIGAFETATPLPIDLKSLSAKKIQEHHLVEWTTLTELNNDYFIVERKINDGDFFELGIVEGSGTTNEEIEYEFRDYHVDQTGMYYYRLTQVDYDGKEQVEGIVAIKPVTGVFEGAKLELVAGFKAAGMMNVDFHVPENGHVTFQLTDVLGRVILGQEHYYEEGMHARSFNLSEAQMGQILILTIQKDGEVVSRKVM